MADLSENLWLSHTPTHPHTHTHTHTHTHPHTHTHTHTHTQTNIRLYRTRHITRIPLALSNLCQSLSLLLSPKLQTPSVWRRCHYLSLRSVKWCKVFVNNDLGRIWKETVFESKGLCLDGLRKFTINSASTAALAVEVWAQYIPRK
jgi:hypothetical protein